MESVGPVEVQIGAGVAGLGAEAGAGQADAQGAGVAQATRGRAGEYGALTDEALDLRSIWPSGAR